MIIKEKGKVIACWQIRRFENRKEWERDRPYSISRFNQNCLLNEGINNLWTVLCGTGGTKFDNANAHLGVGDGSTPAADPSQTGLQGTNKLYKAMDNGYPTYGTLQKATWMSTFESGDANFAWEEFTVANGSSDAADNMNRKVSPEGTKSSGQVWELTFYITLS
jgi:hypothetical protein